MSYPNTHIAKVSVFSFLFFQTLEKEDVPLNKLLRKHPLKNFDLTDPEKFVPLSMMYDFMFEVDRYIGPYGLNALASDQANNYKTEELGDYGRHILATPNLLTFIQEAIKYGNTMATDLSLNLQILGNKARYSFCCTDRPTPGKEFWEALNFIICLQSFRDFCGPDWTPLEIQIPKLTKNIEKILPRGDYHLSCGHPFYAVIFPVEILMLPPPLPANHVGHLELENIEGKLSYRVENLLFNYHSGQIPSLRDFGDFFHLSPRSIRRLLAAEGTTFSEIKERTQFLKAVELVSTTKWKVNEIAEFLGYTETPNFIRFFNRNTGLSPTIYRENLELARNDN